MIIKIFDYTIQKIGLPTDGIIISKWAYGHILNWKDEERLEKLYKEYGDKNLEYLEMEIIEEKSIKRHGSASLILIVIYVANMELIKKNIFHPNDYTNY